MTTTKIPGLETIFDMVDYPKQLGLPKAKYEVLAGFQPIAFTQAVKYFSNITLRPFHKNSYNTVVLFDDYAYDRGGSGPIQTLALIKVLVEKDK